MQSPAGLLTGSTTAQPHTHVWLLIAAPGGTGTALLLTLATEPFLLEMAQVVRSDGGVWLESSGL